MKKLIFIIFPALISIYSCKKDVGYVAAGLYTEQSPMSGEMQLQFIPANHLMIQTETGSTYRDSFYYSLGSGTISLTPAWTNIYPASNFPFQLIDDNTFKIGNLNASIPEAPEIYMIFKK